MGDSITGSVARQLVTSDPGLPRSNPTQSYWQHVPHKLAQAQSASLPQVTNVAVIGSGITSLGVTSTLLRSDPDLHVTVLEARTLCSGATGRNGGQLAISAAENYASWKNAYGPEMAGKIAHFTLRTMERTKELIRHYNIEEAQLSETHKLRLFTDGAKFESVKDSLTQLEHDHPSFKGLYDILDSETCIKQHGTYGAAGAIIHPAGTLWPYRMVTNIFGALLEEFPDRLAMETNTPVTSVSYDGATDADHHPYVLQTPRGSIRAKKVAYCINGYTGHLLPSLRGRMYPYKGTMTFQDLGDAVPNRGSTTSWAVHFPLAKDSNGKSLADGMTYLGQSAKTGQFFYGGEKSTVENIFSANDDYAADTSVVHLKKQLRSLFGFPESQPGELISSWSGIMGCTPDRQPLVGRLPEVVTERQGESEFIAGAYNGYGMVNALLCGEVLGELILGKAVPTWFPEAYFITKERLDTALTVEKGTAVVSGFQEALSS